MRLFYITIASALIITACKPNPTEPPKTPVQILEKGFNLVNDEKSSIALEMADAVTKNVSFPISYLDYSRPEFCSKSAINIRLGFVAAELVKVLARNENSPTIDKLVLYEKRMNFEFDMADITKDECAPHFVYDPFRYTAPKDELMKKAQIILDTLKSEAIMENGSSFDVDYQRANQNLKMN